MSNSTQISLKKQTYPYKGKAAKNTLNTICIFLLFVIFSNGDWKWDVFPSKAPIETDRLTVVIVEETSKRQTIPVEQLNTITSQIWRSYVEGNGGQWRVLDEDTDIDKEAEWVKASMSLDRSSLPWLVYADQKDGYSGPLPNNLEELLEVIKR